MDPNAGSQYGLAAISSIYSVTSTILTRVVYEFCTGVVQKFSTGLLHATGGSRHASWFPLPERFSENSFCDWWTVLVILSVVFVSNVWAIFIFIKLQAGSHTVLTMRPEEDGRGDGPETDDDEESGTDDDASMDRDDYDDGDDVSTDRDGPEQNDGESSSEGSYDTDSTSGSYGSDSDRGQYSCRSDDDSSAGTSSDDDDDDDEPQNPPNSENDDDDDGRIARDRRDRDGAVDRLLGQLNDGVARPDSVHVRSTTGPETRVTTVKIVFRSRTTTDGRSLDDGTAVENRARTRTSSSGYSSVS